MTKKKRKSKLNIGDVYSIPLSNGFAFCVACEGNEFVFFDYLSEQPLLPEHLLSIPVAFKIMVGKGEPDAGEWIPLGNLQVDQVMRSKSKFLHKPVGSDNLYIYFNGESLPATEDEVKNLELFTIWLSDFIVKRLEEHFAGKPCSTTSAIKKQLDITI